MLPALAGTRSLLLRSRVRPNCLLTLLAPFIVSAPTSTAMSRYRADGVRITHDPYAPGMKDTYGAPGQTDRDGFDPYADSVGAGIYGGKVKRDAEGNILIGQQYQNHNPTPGPIYSGEGYTEMSNALHKGESAIAALLEKDPALVNEISTGGAQPLHMAGMSQRNQHATEFLISKGGNIEAEDTYGYRPLHRMASNNLAIGAMALCKAGADVNARTGRGETPLSVAMSSAARDVIAVLKQFGATRPLGKKGAVEVQRLSKKRCQRE